MTSSVIYYSTDARKNEIYLLNTVVLGFLGQRVFAVKPPENELAEEQNIGFQTVSA